MNIQENLNLSSSRPSNDGTFGQRSEKKFVIPKSHLSQVLHKDSNGKDLFAQFKDSYIKKNCSFNIIDNTYLDSEDLKSYHDSLNKIEGRMKIRIRHYSPDGIPEEFCYLEQKANVSGQTRKRRIQIRPEWVPEFLKTGYIPLNEFFAINSENDEAFQILKTMRSLVVDGGYRPVLKSRYVRNAYSLKESKKVRLTVDRSLEVDRLDSTAEKRASYLGKIDKQSVVIELKVASPKFAKYFELFSDVLGESRGFSKYCYGVSSTHADSCELRQLVEEA